MSFFKIFIQIYKVMRLFADNRHGKSGFIRFPFILFQRIYFASKAKIKKSGSLTFSNLLWEKFKK